MICKRDGSVEMSSSPRNQCKKCGQLWFVGSSPPECEAYVSIKKKTTKKQVDNKVKDYLERAEKILHEDRNKIDYSDIYKVASIIQKETHE